MNAYGRLCDHLNASEDWFGDQPFLIQGVFILVGAVGFMVALGSCLYWFTAGGSNCAPGYEDARVESHEYVMTGKVSTPGIVMRHICVPK